MFITLQFCYINLLAIQKNKTVPLMDDDVLEEEELLEEEDKSTLFNPETPWFD